MKREKQYDYDAFRELVQTNVLLLNWQQKFAYDTHMNVVINEIEEIFCLDAFGGQKNYFDHIDFGNESLTEWNLTCTCFIRNCG